MPLYDDLFEPDDSFTKDEQKKFSSMQFQSPRQYSVFQHMIHFLDHKSAFMVQLLVAFMGSVVVGQAVRHQLELGETRRTASSALPVIQINHGADAIRLSLAQVRNPQQANQPAVKPLTKTSLLVASSHVPRLPGARISQPIFVRSIYPRKSVAQASALPHKSSAPDPLTAIRVVLKEDYKISQVKGHYEDYMSWVRQTLKRYRKRVKSESAF